MDSAALTEAAASREASMLVMTRYAEDNCMRNIRRLGVVAAICTCLSPMLYATTWQKAGSAPKSATPGTACTTTGAIATDAGTGAVLSCQAGVWSKNGWTTPTTYTQTTCTNTSSSIGAHKFCALGAINSNGCGNGSVGSVRVNAGIWYLNSFNAAVAAYCLD